MGLLKVFKRVPYDSKEKWLKLRTKGIGGSDASSVLGLNPYKTNLQLYQEKLGLVEPENIDNVFTRYGTVAEGPIRNLFSAKYCDFLKVYHTNELLVSDKYDFIRGSLDGEIEVLEDFTFTSYFKNYYAENEKPYKMDLKKGMKGVLEIKTTNVLSSMSKEKWHNAIPENYYIQILHYLNITKYDFVILVAELSWEDKNGVETEERRYYGFLAKDKQDDLEYLEKEIVKFWNENILKEQEPALKLNI